MVLFNVDDPNGGVLADITMPGHDWDQYRAQGQTPIASGLLKREWVQKAVTPINANAAESVRMMEGFIVVVVSDGVAMVFSPTDQ